jgi:hypothetical protein
MIVGVNGIGGEILKLKNWAYKNQELEIVFKNL